MKRLTKILCLSFLITPILCLAALPIISCSSSNESNQNPPISIETDTTKNGLKINNPKYINFANSLNFKKDTNLSSINDIFIKSINPNASLKSGSEIDKKIIIAIDDIDLEITGFNEPEKHSIFNNSGIVREFEINKEYWFKNLIVPNKFKNDYLSNTDELKNAISKINFTAKNFSMGIEELKTINNFKITEFEFRENKDLFYTNLTFDFILTKISFEFSFSPQIYYNVEKKWINDEANIQKKVWSTDNRFSSELYSLNDVYPYVINNAIEVNNINNIKSTTYPSSFYANLFNNSWQENPLLKIDPNLRISYLNNDQHFILVYSTQNVRDNSFNDSTGTFTFSVKLGRDNDDFVDENIEIIDSKDYIMNDFLTITNYIENKQNTGNNFVLFDKVKLVGTADSRGTLRYYKDEIVEILKLADGETYEFSEKIVPDIGYGYVFDRQTNFKIYTEASSNSSSDVYYAKEQVNFLSNRFNSFSIVRGSSIYQVSGNRLFKISSIYAKNNHDTSKIIVRREGNTYNFKKMTPFTFSNSKEIFNISNSYFTTQGITQTDLENVK